ncbi:MAG: DUF6644 family protein [Acidobacteriota bacterium]
MESLATSLLAACQWLEDTQIGTTIREGGWEYAALNFVHLLGLLFAAGTILFFDLRLLGFGLRRVSVSAAARTLLPWTWAGFAVMLVSGGLLVSSEATRLFTNTAFRTKAVLLVLAGVNVLVFHNTVFRRVGAWDMETTPVQAKVAGAISISVWFGMMAAGRMIGYTL